MTLPKRLMRRFAAVVATAALLSTTAGAGEVVVSKEGMYRLAFVAELEPIVINRLHRWTLRLTDSDGLPVEDATIEVIGGMPEHNHGLPTRPRVTTYLGDGRYQLEGMRFHMQGSWEISVTIDAQAGKDSVLIQLEL